MSQGIDLDVEIYRKIPVGFAVLLLGDGKPRTASARNVIASWLGPDIPTVRAAIAELR